MADSSGGELAEVSSMKPVQNPFQNRDRISDLALVVDGKKLHVHKTLLALHSPVFQSMFFSDFAEKEYSEVELPGKSYDDFVEFLLHLYPDHCMRAITDDTLLAILPLAEEYQTEHVRRKCREHIKAQLKPIRRPVSPLTVDQLLLYLWMCDQCLFHEEKEKLLNALKKKNCDDLVTSKYYDSVDARMMRNFLSASLMDRQRELRQVIQLKDNQVTKLKKDVETKEAEKRQLKEETDELQQAVHLVRADLQLQRKQNEELRVQMELLEHTRHQISFLNCVWSSVFRFPVKTLMFWLGLNWVWLVVVVLWFFPHPYRF